MTTIIKMTAKATTINGVSVAYGNKKDIGDLIKAKLTQQKG